mmetsp:Transcript_66485/g.171963  ORF Transcript_66485/g.171963 Transcript_66485/m.171963 type:complete len:397 (-) Transcript_66485:42-1232(-)
MAAVTLPAVALSQPKQASAKAAESFLGRAGGCRPEAKALATACAWEEAEELHEEEEDEESDELLDESESEPPSSPLTFSSPSSPLLDEPFFCFFFGGLSFFFASPLSVAPSSLLLAALAAFAAFFPFFFCFRFPAWSLVRCLVVFCPLMAMSGCISSSSSSSCSSSSSPASSARSERLRWIFSANRWSLDSSSSMTSSASPSSFDRVPRRAAAFSATRASLASSVLGPEDLLAATFWARRSSLRCSCLRCLASLAAPAALFETAACATLCSLAASLASLRCFRASRASTPLGPPSISTSSESSKSSPSLSKGLPAGGGLPSGVGLAAASGLPASETDMAHGGAHVSDPSWKRLPLPLTCDGTKPNQSKRFRKRDSLAALGLASNLRPPTGPSLRQR